MVRLFLPFFQFLQTKLTALRSDRIFPGTPHSVKRAGKDD
jgi:hypothetical protein